MASQNKKKLEKTHNYVNNQDQFCYISTKYAIPKYRKNITEKIWAMYAKYFNVKFPKQDEICTPQIICSCTNNLEETAK